MCFSKTNNGLHRTLGRWNNIRHGAQHHVSNCGLHPAPPSLPLTLSSPQVHLPWHIVPHIVDVFVILSLLQGVRLIRSNLGSPVFVVIGPGTNIRESTHPVEGITCSFPRLQRRASTVAHSFARAYTASRAVKDGTFAHLQAMEGKKNGLKRRSSGALGSAGQLVRSSSVKHIELLVNGDFHLDIKFSYMVALSSLLYWGVAMAYFAYQRYPMGVLFVLIGIFSLLADSVLPHSKFVNSFDRLFATLGTLCSPVRLIFWCAKASILFRIKVALMLLVSLAILNWSRSSTSQKEFVVRHTVWHAFSAAGLSYIAIMEGAGILSFEFLT